MPKKASSKDNLAHQRLDDHEKLCRIMQENTNKKNFRFTHRYTQN